MAVPPGRCLGRENGCPPIYRRLRAASLFQQNRKRGVASSAVYLFIIECGRRIVEASGVKAKNAVRRKKNDSRTAATPSLRKPFHHSMLCVHAERIQVCSLTVHLHLNRRHARFPGQDSDFVYWHVDIGLTALLPCNYQRARTPASYFRFARKSSRTFCTTSFGSNFGS